MTAALIGVGACPETLTAEAAQALEKADLVIGSRRLLESLGVPGVAAVRSAEIARLLAASGAEAPCVVFSGDTGFYSGAASLLPLLKEKEISARLIPGLSSIQLFAAQLGRPWQGWNLISAHGKVCDPVAAVMGGKPACFLTGVGAQGPAALCAILTEAGLGALPVTVGENLFMPDEALISGTAAQLAEREFGALSVMLAEAAPAPWGRWCGGIPDGEFTRSEGIPMTKQMVRAGILALLSPAPGETLWDVGAGTGSVSVELALSARGGKVFAVEQSAEGISLIRENKVRFGAWNLRAVPGMAPDALAGLPAPDAVFVGGSKGALEPILRAALAANPKARICVSAIAAETFAGALSAMKSLGLTVSVTQISAAESRPAGSLHLMMGQNPVWLILGVAE